MVRPPPRVFLEQVITKGVEFGAKGKIDNHYWEATYFHFINFDDIQFVSTGTGKSSGYFKNFKEDMYETSVEIYYKEMENLIEYKEGILPEDNTNTCLLYTSDAADE